MTIQMKFFTIPVKSVEENEVELNRFLGSHKILTIKREFVNNGYNSFWSVDVEYFKTQDEKKELPGKSKIDYKEILSPDDFSVFAKLREWRKKVAGKESVPVYTVFTNEQLAQITKKKVRNNSELKTIEGIGEARIKKYAEQLFEMLENTKTA